MNECGGDTDATLGSQDVCVCVCVCVRAVCLAARLRLLRRRNKIGKKLKKAQQNIVTLEKEKLIAKIDSQRQKRAQELAEQRRKKKKLLEGVAAGGEPSDAEVSQLLGRFKKRRR